MSGSSAHGTDYPSPAAVYNASGLQYFRHAGALGSAVLTTNVSRALLSSGYYAPFGFDESGAGAGYRSFTGAEQNIDSSHTGGQYDFAFREYNSLQGRWWTPDPAGLTAVDPNNPQSWNQYAYVDGQPLEATDPSGLRTVNCLFATTRSARSGGCGGAWMYGCGGSVMIDGVLLSAGLGSSMEAEGGGAGGGGSPSVLSAYVCATADCQGANAAFSPSGGIYGDLVGGASCSGLDCRLWTLAVPSPALASCYRNGACAVTANFIAPGQGYQPGGGASPPFRPAPLPAPPATIQSPITYSRSYSAFLACEYLHTLGNEHTFKAWAAVNGGTLVAILNGNLYAGGAGLGLSASFDLMGAEAIRSACSYVTYGP